MPSRRRPDGAGRDGAAPQRRLPRSARILSQAHFDRVYRQGRKLVAPGLIAWALPSDTGLSRIGLSVSRKVGGAVQRNRVKRVLREAFRQIDTPTDPPLDLVLVARPGRAPETLADARTALQLLLRRWSTSPPTGR